MREPRRGCRLRGSGGGFHDALVRGVWCVALIVLFAGVAVMHALDARGIDVKYLFLFSVAIILAGCAMQLSGVRAGSPQRAGTRCRRRLARNAATGYNTAA
jgi:apolipoprotein N-acyltransferase